MAGITAIEAHALARADLESRFPDFKNWSLQKQQDYISSHSAVRNVNTSSIAMTAKPNFGFAPPALFASNMAYATAGQHNRAPMGFNDTASNITLPTYAATKQLVLNQGVKLSRSAALKTKQTIIRAYNLAQEGIAFASFARRHPLLAAKYVAGKAAKAAPKLVTSMMIRKSVQVGFIAAATAVCAPLMTTAGVGLAITGCAMAAGGVAASVGTTFLFDKEATKQKGWMLESATRGLFAVTIGAVVSDFLFGADEVKAQSSVGMDWDGQPGDNDPDMRQRNPASLKGSATMEPSWIDQKLDKAANFFGNLFSSDAPPPVDTTEPAPVAAAAQENGGAIKQEISSEAAAPAIEPSAALDTNPLNQAVDLIKEKTSAVKDFLIENHKDYKVDTSVSTGPQGGNHVGKDSPLFTDVSGQNDQLNPVHHADKEYGKHGLHKLAPKLVHPVGQPPATGNVTQIMGEKINRAVDKVVETLKTEPKPEIERGIMDPSREPAFEGPGSFQEFLHNQFPDKVPMPQEVDPNAPQTGNHRGGSTQQPMNNDMFGPK